MELTSLSVELIDLILSVLPLDKLLRTRQVCQILHSRVQQRFLPVIAPPELAAEVLSMDMHGKELVSLFAAYQSWLQRWRRIYFQAHPGFEKRVASKLRELRAQNSALDGYFSLAPWWRAFGEIVAHPWQPEAWLQEAVYPRAPTSTADGTAAGSTRTPELSTHHELSAFYQRRERLEEDAFRIFYSTPAEAFPTTKPRTNTIILAPLDVLMEKRPTRSHLASLPTLSRDILDMLAAAGELLHSYLPTLDVQIKEVRTHVLPSVAGLTRGDKQDARTADGKRVRQLSSRALHGARNEIDTAYEDSVEQPFVAFVVAPHLFPHNCEQLAWVYSTSLEHVEPDGRIDAWGVSIHQLQAFMDDERALLQGVCNLISYCAFTEAIDLQICESKSCVMNNCDSIGEMAQVSTLLCPTCMRKLHLMGLVADVPGCYARVREVMERRGLF